MSLYVCSDWNVVINIKKAISSPSLNYWLSQALSHTFPVEKLTEKVDKTMATRVLIVLFNRIEGKLTLFSWYYVFYLHNLTTSYAYSAPNIIG